MLEERNFKTILITVMMTGIHSSHFMQIFLPSFFLFYLEFDKKKVKPQQSEKCASNFSSFSGIKNVFFSQEICTAKKLTRKWQRWLNQQISRIDLYFDLYNDWCKKNALACHSQACGVQWSTHSKITILNNRVYAAESERMSKCANTSEIPSYENVLCVIPKY